MICNQCFKSSLRLFYRDGVCEECDPDAGPQKSRDEHPHWWHLSHVTAMAMDFMIREPWITESYSRDKGVTASWVSVLHGWNEGVFNRTLPGADECDAWIRSLLSRPEAHCSDYENTLVRLVRQGFVGEADFPLAAGAYHAWKKTQAEDSPSSPLPTGQWLGEPGQRLDIHGCQCVEARALPANPDHPEWGVRWLIKFTSSSGCKLTWFASESKSEKGFDPKVGETYNITATIKSHDEYNGERATLINRCREAKA